MYRQVVRAPQAVYKRLSVPKQLIRIALVLLLSVSVFPAARSVVRAQQKCDNLQIDRGRGILRDARDSVKKYYYDPKYHGLDLEALYQQYDE